MTSRRRTTRTASSTRPRLIGHWALVALEVVKGREVEYPMGRDARGVLTYSEKGHMAAQIMQTNRPRFASEDVARATPAELSAALTGYTAYFGTYAIDESSGVVTHQVTGSLFPNWVGTEQRRAMVLEGDLLTLSSEPILFKGQMRVFRAIWKRREER